MQPPLLLLVDIKVDCKWQLKHIPLSNQTSRERNLQLVDGKKKGLRVMVEWLDNVQIH